MTKVKKFLMPGVYDFGMELPKFDLAERTTHFAVAVLRLIAEIPRDQAAANLIPQLIKCATSVGANYAEADNAESRKDFRHKIGICRKESQEAKYWLTLLSATYPILELRISPLLQEAKELNLIFNAIHHKLLSNANKGEEISNF